MLETYCTTYEFYQDRILYRRGVLSVTTDEILIHRIKSINLHEPFLYRIVGISNLRIISSDKFVPQIELTGIPVGREIMDVLRQLVEQNRSIKGTKEFDIYDM